MASFDRHVRHSAEIMNAGRLDDEYKSFLAELGGGPGGGGARPSGFSGPPGGGYQGERGPRQRPGDELPDDCKLCAPPALHVGLGACLGVDMRGHKMWVILQLVSLEEAVSGEHLVC